MQEEYNTESEVPVVVQEEYNTESEVPVVVQEEYNTESEVPVVVVEEEEPAGHMGWRKDMIHTLFQHLVLGELMLGLAFLSR